MVMYGVMNTKKMSYTKSVLRSTVMTFKLGSLSVFNMLRLKTMPSKSWRAHAQDSLRNTNHTIVIASENDIKTNCLSSMLMTKQHNLQVGNCTMHFGKTSYE